MVDAPIDNPGDSPIPDIKISSSTPPVDDGYGIVGTIRTLTVGSERWKVFEYHSPVTGLRRLAVERTGVVTDVGMLPPSWRDLADAELLTLLGPN